MYRVTTPTHIFTLPNDTSAYSVIQISYKQKKVELVKQYENGTCPSGMTLDEKDVIIVLTQEETKAFKGGIVQSQVRVLTNGGNAYASQMFNISINDVINEEIL